MAPRPAKQTRDIDLVTYRVRSARFHNVKPTTPGTGEVFEHTARSRIGWWDGTDFRYFAHVANNDATFAYNGDGTVDTITLTSGVLTFAYDVNGDVETITNTDTGITTNISYLPSGDVDTITYTDTL